MTNSRDTASPATVEYIQVTKYLIRKYKIYYFSDWRGGGTN